MFPPHGARSSTPDDAPSLAAERCLDVARAVGLGTYDYNFVTGEVKRSRELRDILGLQQIDSVALVDPDANAPLGDFDSGDWIFPEDRLRVRDAWRDAQDPSGTGEFEEEYRALRPDGHVIWLMDKAQVLFEDGPEGRRAVNCCGVLLNISSRKHAEAARRVKRERLAVALAASKTGTFHWNMITDELIFDEAMTALWGLLPSDQPLSMNQALARVHAEDRAPLLQSIARSAREGADVELECRVERPDGEERWVLAKGKPLLSTEGKPVYMTGACVDITRRKQVEARLQQEMAARALENRRLQAVLDALPVGVFITDAEGRILRVNDASLALWGRPAAPERLEDYKDFKGWWPDSGQRLRVRDWGLARVLRRGEAVAGEEVEIEAADGTRRTILYHASPIRDDADRMAGAVAVTVDISERRRVEDQLRYLADIVASSQDSIVGLSFDARVTSWNEGAEKLYGYSRSEMMGRHIGVLDPSPTKDEMQKMLELVKQGKRLEQRETIRRRKDGQEIWVAYTVSPILSASGKPTGASVIARDVTERKRMEELLHHDALHDKLTGLANRALFIDRLTHLIDRAQRYGDRYAVLVLDIDNFKLINDSLGHLAGDQLLRDFSARVQEVLRPVDTMARFGGDEFTLLLEDVENEAAVVHIADRIQECLQVPFSLSGRDVRVTSSVGVTLGDWHYKTSDEALRDADLALYEAKRRGKAQYVIFDAQMRKQNLARRHLEAELRQAIARKALSVEFQPIVDLESRRWLGCEALVRWHHPVMGDMEPRQFLEVADDSGLITELGRLVLAEACQALATWLRLPMVAPEFYISINVSSKEFYSPDLLQFLRSLLASHGLQGRNLRLEVSEDVIMEHESMARPILEDLQGMGVQVCVDNFGRGNSSLNYLHQLPIGVVKIDCSLIQSLPEDEQCREVTRSILNLAEVLNFQSIAECTETQAQLEHARAVGFRSAQGFALHQPMARGEINKLLNEVERIE